MTLYGFFHTTCIYESAAALVSLHMTKRSAWKAMNRAQWQAWERLRDVSETNYHQDRDYWRMMRQRLAYTHERSHIGAVEVQP